MNEVVPISQRETRENRRAELASETLEIEESVRDSARRDIAKDSLRAGSRLEAPSGSWVARPDTAYLAPNRSGDTAYIYMNGIFTDAEIARRDGQATANAYGRDVLVVHNGTDGARDLLHATAAVLDPEAGAALEERAISDLCRSISAELSSGRGVHLVLHSQGTLIGERALARFSPEELSRISVDAYGAANHSWPAGLRGVTEYCHDLDGVRFGTMQLVRLQSVFNPSGESPLRIVTVPSASLDPIFGAHTFSGAGGYMHDTARFLIARSKPQSPDPELTSVVDKVYAMMEMYSRRIWGVDPDRLVEELHSSARSGEFSGATYHQVVDWAIHEGDCAFAAAFLERCPDGTIGDLSFTERQMGMLREMAARSDGDRTPLIVDLYEAAGHVSSWTAELSASARGYAERAVEWARTACANLIEGVRGFFRAFVG